MLFVLISSLLLIQIDALIVKTRGDDLPRAKSAVVVICALNNPAPEFPLNDKAGRGFNDPNGCAEFLCPASKHDKYKANPVQYVFFS